MRSLLRITLIVLLALAPALAPAGGGPMPSAQEVPQDQGVAAAPDQDCPAGDCGEHCPPVKCLIGYCSISAIGLGAETATRQAPRRFAHLVPVQPVLGQSLLPDTPPPRG